MSTEELLEPLDESTRSSVAAFASAMSAHFEAIKETMAEHRMSGAVAASFIKVQDRKMVGSPSGFTTASHCELHHLPSVLQLCANVLEEATSSLAGDMRKGADDAAQFLADSQNGAS